MIDVCFAYRGRELFNMRGAVILDILIKFNQSYLHRS